MDQRLIAMNIGWSMRNAKVRIIKWIVFVVFMIIIRRLTIRNLMKVRWMLRKLNGR